MYSHIFFCDMCWNLGFYLNDYPGYPGDSIEICSDCYDSDITESEDWWHTAEAMQHGKTKIEVVNVEYNPSV